MGRFSPTPDELLRLTREYHPPRVNVGDEMQCEIRGLSIVRDWHDAPIMWPVTCERHKRRSLIVTGDAEWITANPRPDKRHAPLGAPAATPEDAEGGRTPVART